MKKPFTLIFTFVIVLVFSIFSEKTYASSASTAVGVNVEYHTQEEIIDYIHNVGKASPEDPLTFSSQPVTAAPYALGSLSEETLGKAINMLNQIRYIAGISHDVKLSDSFNEMAQAAALVNYVNDDLNHYPQQPADMDDGLFELASTGANSSNLAWASWANRSLNETQVLGWMEDGDPSNIDRVGHRRWMLNPSMGQTGFGAVTGANGTYSAVFAFDRSNASADETGVMWPAQNMPVDYFSTYFPWSISMGETVTADQVSVTLMRRNDGKTWNFSSTASDGYFNVNNDGYGQTGCIIFRPNSSEIGSYRDGDVFDVIITGVPNGTVSYTVNFFDPHDYGEIITKAGFDTNGSIVKKCKLCESITMTTTIASIKQVSLSNTDFTYNGAVQVPEITVTDSYGCIVDPSNYTVTYPESSITVGEYSVKIAFQNLYTGDILKTYRINAANPDNHGSKTDNNGQETLPDAWAPIGKTSKTSTGRFQVNGKGTVTFTAPVKKSSTKITIPAAIQINGKKYTVTKIAKNAFKNNKTLKTAVIGKNVKKIGQGAFYGCKKLKSVDIRSSKLNSIGKKAFLKINNRAVFKVPKSKVKSYKKLMKGKIPSKAKMKKR